MTPIEILILKLIFLLFHFFLLFVGASERPHAHTSRPWKLPMQPSSVDEPNDRETVIVGYMRRISRIFLVAPSV